MIKRIGSILLVFAFLGTVGMYFHRLALEYFKVILPFSLQKLYLFHIGFSLLICINLQFLTKIAHVSEQLGFIYLGTLLLKIILFSVVFNETVIASENLAVASKISLLIPTFIFLLVEVFFIAKILNKRQ